MPQPTPSDAHVNAVLTDFSIAYVQEADNFVADKIFPNIGVAKQSDLYYTFSREDFLRDEAKPRAPASESAGGGFALGTGQYFCPVYAYHKDIDDQLRANADAALSLDEAATAFVTQKMLISRERQFATKAFGTGIWGTDITPGTLWSASGSTPRDDVEKGKRTIMSKSGMKPNKLLLGYNTYSALRVNNQICDQFKYTGSQGINKQMMADFFDVDEVIVGGGVFSNTVEGTAAPADPNFILGNHALLVAVTPTPSIMMPSAGYTFNWSGYHGMQNGIRIKNLRADLLESDRIEGDFAYDLRVTASSLGYFFNGAVA